MTSMPLTVSSGAPAAEAAEAAGAAAVAEADTVEVPDQVAFIG
jgi:hypothetical protein